MRACMWAYYYGNARKSEAAEGFYPYTTDFQQCFNNG